MSVRVPVSVSAGRGEYVLVVSYYTRQIDSLQELDAELTTDHARDTGHLKLPSCHYRSASIQYACSLVAL